MKRIIKSCAVFLLTLVITDHCFANAAATPVPLLRLQMQKDSINTDEIIIKCNNSATTQYDVNLDAKDIGGMGALVSLSAYSSDNIPLVIDALPFPGLQQQVVPLLTGASASGTYKLVSTQVYNFPSLYEVWLKDAFTGDSLKLVTNAAYSFNIDKSNPATFGSKRFTVIIRLNPAIGYQLQSFGAAKQSGGQVQLNWKMLNEQKNTNYTIQRSLDTGKTFTDVGSLAGTGAGSYSLADNSPASGQNYYRLKLVDSILTVSYSGLITTPSGAQFLTNSSNLQVYPNPVTTTVNISVAQAPQTVSYNITVSNSAGVIVKKANSTQPTWAAGVSTLLPGTYQVKVTNTTDNSLVGESKFVKL